MAILKKNGAVVGMVPKENLNAWFINHKQDSEDYDIELSGDEIRSSIRQDISAKAGDTQAILGTTADATQLLLYVLCTITTKLNKATSLAEVREATAEIEPMATAFLAKVATGKVKLPFMAKGLASVITDIETRATAVADVLQSINRGE